MSELPVLGRGRGEGVHLRCTDSGLYLSELTASQGNAGPALLAAPREQGPRAGVSVHGWGLKAWLRPRLSWRQQLQPRA